MIRRETPQFYLIDQIMMSIRMDPMKLMTTQQSNLRIYGYRTKHPFNAI
jgi:hypothetical protein